MKFNLLDFVVCPKCGENLHCLPFEVIRGNQNFKHFCQFWCSSKSILIVKRIQCKMRVSNPIDDFINFKNSSEIDREDCCLCQQYDIIQGIIICTHCFRFFQVTDSIPEVLPDILRNLQKDLEFLDKYRKKIEFGFDRVMVSLASNRNSSAIKKNGQWGFKKAEMNLTRREDLPNGFFGPGYVVPFEPLHPVRSIENIHIFIISAQNLNLRYNDLVLDLGVGYAWTTEWLAKLGYRVIGVDINRDYLQIGMHRTHNTLPPLLIADVENLPLRKEAFQGIFFYDSFHHLANRETCLKNLSHLLVSGGVLLMAEPGPRHENHPASIQVMKTYGILEKGITKEEIEDMIQGTSFECVNKFPYDYGDMEILQLKKSGQRNYTSAGPDFLNAQVKIEKKEIVAKIGQEFDISLLIKNSGNTVWLNRTADGTGEVRIGFQLKNSKRGIIDENFHRSPIPRDIQPEESFSATVILPSILSAGEYFLEIDLVAERIIWFKDIAHNPTIIELRIIE